MKRKWYRIQEKNNTRDRMWDYEIYYFCETVNLTVNICRYSNRITPLEIIIYETPDVSEYLDFGFYDWVTYQNNAGLGLPKVVIWLGVYHLFGKLMSYCILDESGIPLSCNTLQRITNLEK